MKIHKRSWLKLYTMRSFAAHHSKEFLDLDHKWGRYGNICKGKFSRPLCFLACAIFSAFCCALNCKRKLKYTLSAGDGNKILYCFSQQFFWFNVDLFLTKIWLNYISAHVSNWGTKNVYYWTLLCKVLLHYHTSLLTNRRDSFSGLMYETKAHF